MASPLVKVKSPKARIKYDPELEEILGIAPVDLARWATLYPAVDLKREQGRATEWLTNHPEKRRSNIAQFLANWFERDQNDIARGRKPAAGAGGKPQEEDWTKKPYGGVFNEHNVQVG